jgi:hypothetical protein
MAKAKTAGRKKGSKAKGSGDWIPVFLSAMQLLPNIRVACQQAGVSRAEAYRTRAKDPKFAIAWAEAKQDGIDVIEAHLMALAQKNVVAGIFMLKNLRPEVYGENVNVNVTGTLSIEEVRQARASLNAKLTQIIDVVAPGDRRLLTSE